MIYDLEHFDSFKNNCEKDKEGNILRETYLPKTLKYCVEHNIEVLPHSEHSYDEDECDIYIPCYLFVIRHVYYYITERDEHNIIKCIDQ